MEYYILILGLDYSGKTVTLEQLKATFAGVEPLPPSKISPTVGLNIGRMQVINGLFLRIQWSGR